VQCAGFDDSPPVSVSSRSSGIAMLAIPARSTAEEKQ
jgi:hypothetical protein